MTETDPAPTEYLFVYGTLRQGAEHPLADLLNRRADFIGPAVARGKLYLVAGYPGMVDSENPTELVYGDLFQLQPGSTLLQQLDDYEECGPNYSEPTEYLRRQRWIATAQRAKYPAWLYLYNRSVEHLPRIEGGDYLADRETP